MKFKQVKALLKMSAIITIISVLTNTSSAFAFSKQPSIDKKQVTEAFVNRISTIIDETDLLDEDELDSLEEDLVSSSNKYAKENNLGEFQKVSIIRVIDGDTIVVDIEGDNCGKKNHERTIRLIGIDTPESVASDEYLKKTGKENTEDGVEASDYTKSFLSNYDYAYLQQDVSNTDKYDRLLRYVWIDVPTDEYDLGEISTDMLNGALIIEGYATPATYYPDVKYEEEFEQLHNEAKEECDY